MISSQLDNPIHFSWMSLQLPNVAYNCLANKNFTNCDNFQVVIDIYFHFLNKKSSRDTTFIKTNKVWFTIRWITPPVMNSREF